MVRGISDPIKTEQVINCEHARLGHYPKKESQLVEAEYAENGNQIAGNGIQVPKSKSSVGAPHKPTGWAKGRSFSTIRLSEPSIELQGLTESSYPI